MTAGQWRISGKNLGALALFGACPRCFWIKQRLKRAPYSVFPGIFSTFDAFSKRIVHDCFDLTDSAPEWLASLGPLRGYANPPGHGTFQLLHEETGILLTGAADGIYVREDGSLIIVDYKTARHTENQDKLRPMYDVQLNAYALIAESIGLAPVTALALIYFDPTMSSVNVLSWLRDYGFDMGFFAHLVSVELDPHRVHALLRQAKEILELSSPPKGFVGCKDCEAVDYLRALRE